MTSHRAAYLRRAIPRLSEQYRPRYELIMPASITPWQAEVFRQAFSRRMADIKRGFPSMAVLCDR